MDDKKVVWISVGLLTISVFIVSFITFGVMRETSAVENRVVKLRDMAKQLADEVRVDKPEALINSATTDSDNTAVTVSASEIGEEVIELQNVLGDLFCMDGNMPRDIVERRLEEGPKLGKRLSELTNIDAERYQYESWKLNKEWTLDLASVIAYEKTDRIPVVFTMETEEGERIGLIKAMYDVEAYQLTDIEKHYPSISNSRLFLGIGGG